MINSKKANKLVDNLKIGLKQRCKSAYK